MTSPGARRREPLGQDGPVQLSYFHADGDLLVPGDLARSAWSKDQMHGVAVSGALARGAERLVADLGMAELVPSRLTVDLFRPARMVPGQVRAEVVRQGSRLCLVDVALVQDDEPVTRASVLFLRPTESGTGEIWAPGERPGPPPEDIVPPSDQPRVPFVRSSAGWSQQFAEHQNSDRKQSWSTAVPVVAGERLSPFQAAAAAADGASLVGNWGSHGVQHINSDLTLTLARRPVGVEIGLSAVDRVEVDGVAVCTVAVFDRSGPLGTVVLTALANLRRAIDFRRVQYDDDGNRVTTNV